MLRLCTLAVARGGSWVEERPGTTVPDNRVNASDDVIGALSERVGELSKRVNDIQAELEAAQKRLAVYEEFDATIQDAVSGALRAAYQIRERAESTANQILEQAREERRLLLKEVERLRDERDALMEEVAHTRRGGIAAVAPRRGPTTESADASSSSELRSLATEALRSMFKGIVEDLVREERPTQAPEPVRARASDAVSAPEAAPAPEVAERAPAPAPVAAAPTPEVPIRAPEAETQAAVEPKPAPPPAPAAVAPTPAPPAAGAEPMWPAAEERPAPRPPLYAVERPAPETPATVEDTEMAPEREEPAGPVSDIQMVLSPVGSFARLVEIERRIQTLQPVRSLYVRDFRGGVATLSVGLRNAMTLDQFADALRSLGQPALRPISASRNILELRLEGDASIA